MDSLYSAFALARFKQLAVFTFGNCNVCCYNHTCKGRRSGTGAGDSCLDEKSVAEATKIVQPFGIDICSGFRSVGKPDWQKPEVFLGN